MNKYVIGAAIVLAVLLGLYFFISGSGPLANQGPDVLNDPTPATPVPSAEPAAQELDGDEQP
ncbi:MAG: hypothetical protein ACU0CI_07385 [Shimia sp.]